jgi:glycosyltransferase involved in cell wall biosynthesis
MSSLYVTFDVLDPDSGAGKVCIHEITALAKATQLKGILCRADPQKTRETLGWPVRTVNLEKAYPFNPFLYDYFNAEQLDGTCELMHLSCSPGNALLAKVRPKHYVTNIVAHDLRISIEEHERITGTPYPFLHNTDPVLHETLIKHARKADIVFTPSHASEKWIKENIAPKRIEVIPHGCDWPENIPPLPSPFHSAGLSLGYMGAHGPDKGLLYLLMAWNKLAYKDAELVLAGPCTQSLGPMIKEFCPNGIIRSLGWVAKPVDFFKEVNVCVVPSVTEGFGLLGLEAMAHGRSAIVSTGAGCADIVTDHKDGILVPPRSAKAIADAIASYISEPKQMFRMGKAARTKAKRYTWSKVEQIYERVYKELIES